MREYALAAVMAGICTAACFAMFPFLAPANLVMVYLLGTLLVARRGHRGPAILSSFLGVLCFDFFFVPPRYDFAVSDTQYIFTFLVMFAVALLISHLTTRIKGQAESARLGEERAMAMHALSSRLASARGADSILQVAARHMADVLDLEVDALLPKEGRLEPRAEPGESRSLDEKERGVAQWVFESGQPAGLGTRTLPVSDALYVPLKGSQGPVGVLRVRPQDAEGARISAQMPAIESCAHQVGLALEVDRLQESAKQAQLEAEKERLRSSLLSSVSHDLRTPLAGILGSTSSLLQSGSAPAGVQARELLENIQSEGERLSRLVNNLIETTRLESGGTRLRKESYPIEEVIGLALERVDKSLAGRKVTAALPEDLPLVPIDSILLGQVFVNLLENAARHTPPGTPLRISAQTQGDHLLMDVADRGPGLAREDLERVFEKFYHAKSPSAGAGLGLAICRAIVNAHGGRIWAENRPEGGAAFRFTLPLKETDGRS